MWYQFDRVFIKGEGIKIISYNSKMLLTIATIIVIFRDIASNNWRVSFGHYFLFSFVLFRINSSSINKFSLCFVLKTES